MTESATVATCTMPRGTTQFVKHKTRTNITSNLHADPHDVKMSAFSSYIFVLFKF